MVPAYQAIDLCQFIHKVAHIILSVKAISNWISVALDLFRLFVYPHELTHHDLHDNALVVAYRADAASRVAERGPMLINRFFDVPSQCLQVYCAIFNQS